MSQDLHTNSPDHIWTTLYTGLTRTTHAQSEGRDSSVGIATRYRLDGPEIKSRWGRDFPHPSSLVRGPTRNGYRVFPEGKAAGAWRWPPTQSTAEVKEKVELYLYSPSEHSWPKVNFTFALRMRNHAIHRKHKHQQINSHINPLTLELDTYSLAHHLGKMRIFYEPRRVTLGNTRHFEEE